MENKALSNEARLIRIDIIDAAYRLWAERYEEIIQRGVEYGRGPSADVAWDKYIERGAHNYSSWFTNEDEPSAAYYEARAAFRDAFEDAPGVYGMLHSR
jgi:hypothetical protein